MNGSRIGQQFHALFGIFMVAFYLGIGIFILFFARNRFNIDKAISVMMGSTFIFYGIYRIFVSIKLIREAFFKKDNDDEEI